MPERNAWTPFFWCVRMGEKQGAKDESEGAY